MFQKAKPVWLKDMAWEMNCFATFSAETDAVCGELLIAVSGFYRLFVNGRFVSAGPARTAGGYARVDRIPVSALPGEAGMKLRIETANYCCTSLSSVKQAGFLAAELQADDREVLLYTGRDFRAFVSGRKVRYVERFSLQRHFGEVWDERADAAECREAELVPAESSPVWLERRAPYPDYHTVMTGEAIMSTVR